MEIINDDQIKQFRAINKKDFETITDEELKQKMAELIMKNENNLKNLNEMKDTMEKNRRD
jgi:hypothetical protein